MEQLSTEVVQDDGLVCPADVPQVESAAQHDVPEAYLQTQTHIQRSAETHFMLTVTHGRKLRDNTRYGKLLSGHAKIMAVLNRFKV